MREIVRTGNPYSLSVEELAHRQIAIGQNASGGVLFHRRNRGADSEDKLFARGRVVSLFKPKRWAGSLSILTLPGVSWFFERALLSVREGNWETRTQPARHTHITSCEIDPAIFAGASMFIPRTPNAAIVSHPMSPKWTARTVETDAIRRFHNCDVYALMEHNGHTFDAAWLDFNGTLTPERLQRIAAFYRDFIRGMIVLTFLRARTTRPTGADIAECGGTLEWITDSLPGDVLQFFHYGDNGSHMVQIAIAKPECGYDYGE